MSTASTTTGTARLVPMSSIKLDKHAWPRRELDNERVQLFRDLYEHDADTVPPVEVFVYQEPGKQKPVYLLVDGWHRVEARKKLHLANVSAIIRDDLKTLDDAFIEACRHSAQASKPLSSKEKREAVRRILKTHHSMSDRQIARAVGCSHTLVAKMHNPIRRGLGTVSDFLTSDGAAAERSAPITRTLEERVIDLFLRLDPDVDTLTELMMGEEEVRGAVQKWGGAFILAYRATDPTRAGNIGNT